MVLFDVVPTYIVYVPYDALSGALLASRLHAGRPGPRPRHTTLAPRSRTHNTQQDNTRVPGVSLLPWNADLQEAREAEQENTHSKDYNHTSLPHFYISLLSSRVSALEVAQLG